MTQNEKGTRTGHLQGRTTMRAVQLNQPVHAYPLRNYFTLVNSLTCHLAWMTK